MSKKNIIIIIVIILILCLLFIGCKRIGNKSIETNTTEILKEEKSEIERDDLNSDPTTDEVFYETDVRIGRRMNPLTGEVIE